MTQVNFMRHASYFGPEDASDKSLTIIGAGATGSWVALIAAKMGWHNFSIWDSDLVESHNLPNQVYGVEHIGMQKVDALEQVLKTFNPQCSVTKHNEFFIGTNLDHKETLEDYVYVAVDSLSARKDIISNCLHLPFTDLIFETKMGFQHAEINIFSPSNEQAINSYLGMLKNDDEVQESACDAKIITTLTTIVASTLVHALCGHASLSRRSEDTFYDSKQIISLQDKLTTISF